MPPTKSWKNFELRICRRFGGQRRGAEYGDRQGGKNDCKCTPGWSIEMKNWKRPTFTAMLEDARKAEQRREKPSDIPLAIMKKVGDEDNDALVVMRLETFEKVVMPMLTETRLMKELGY